MNLQTNNPSPALLEAIAVTAELLGTAMTPASARVFAEDVSRYPERQVLAALTRCRREVRGRLTIADVLSRIDDGRPGVEEAWSLLPKSEADSAAMTPEMLAGYAAAAPLLGEGDMVGARMAFKEVYTTACQRARDAGEQAHWAASLGHSVVGRHDAKKDAERRNAAIESRPERLLERDEEPLRLAHLKACVDRSPPPDIDAVRKSLGELRTMTEENRQRGRAAIAEAMRAILR